MEVNGDEINQTTDSTVDIEKQTKFREESKERMSKICSQISYLEKIASKRSVDYTKDDVDKMFSYLEKQLADCKAAFMTRFEDGDKAKAFDFEF